MQANITGGGNTVIGSLANVGGNNLHNATAIGYDAIVSASDKVRIGNTNVTVIEGQVPFSSPSDGRFKNNIREEVKGLDFIMKLRPVVYNFISSKYDAYMNGGIVKTGNDYAAIEKIRQSGFIAQEVEAAAKSVGYDFNGVKVPASEKDTYSVSYSQFVVPLVKAVQEQQKEIEELRSQLAELKKIVLQPK